MFDHLFTSLHIGSAVLKNRICFTAHETNFADNCRITERLTKYYQQRALGGCGLIILGELSIHPHDRPKEKMIQAYQPGIADEYLKFTNTIHETECLIFAQLCHHGFQSSSTISRQATLAPSAISDIVFGETAKAMEYEDMCMVSDSFLRAAVSARDGGFDGLEIDMGPESLLRQFLSLISNHRQDEYGGSLENRIRFPLEVIHKVRGAVGDDFPLGIQLCADEMFYGGIIPDESCKMAQILTTSEKIDFLNLSVGTYYNLQLVQPSMHTPFGFATDSFQQTNDAVNIPVLASHHIPSMAAAEQIISNGQANAVGLVRNLICDPLAPNKAQQGESANIVQCARDNQGCVGRINQSKALSCIQNPTVGFELSSHESDLISTSTAKKVIVIGGGPAGLEAAKIAGLRGHRVTIYEKKNRIGGQINLSLKGAGRKSMGIVIRNLYQAVEKLQIPIITNMEVTKQFILDNNPDAVIVATGSKPVTHPLPGEYCPPLVLNVPDVLNEMFPIGETILFIDHNGGHKTTATVELLANQGKQVKLITNELFVGVELASLGDLYATRQRLLKKGVIFKTDILVDEIRDNIVKARRLYNNAPIKFEGYDTIILNMENKVEDNLYQSLKGVVKNLIRIGDCVAPRGVEMAIFEGYKAGKMI